MRVQNPVSREAPVIRAHAAFDWRERELRGHCYALASDQRDGACPVGGDDRVKLLRKHSSGFGQAGPTPTRDFHQAHCNHVLRLQSEIGGIHPQFKQTKHNLFSVLYPPLASVIINAGIPD
jgi:hypothetical protein